MLLEFKILPSVRLFIKSERWQVVGFCPRAASAGVFGDKPEPSFSHVWVLEALSPMDKAIGLYSFITLT